MMGNALKSRSSTTKLRGRRMFKREFHSPKHMQMRVLAAEASRLQCREQKMKTKSCTTEEFISASLYYLNFHFTSNHKTSVLLFLPSLLKACVFYEELAFQSRLLSTT